MPKLTKIRAMEVPHFKEPTSGVTYQLKYEDPWRRGKEGFSLEKNKPFYDEVAITGSVRGRSAAGFVVKSLDGKREYYMFLKELMRLIEVHGIGKGGQVKGTWCYVKHGANYSIAFLETEKLQVPS